MTRSFFGTLALVVFASAAAFGQDAERPAAKSSKMTTQELADWIDARFAKEYEAAGVKPADTVDDARFLRRIFLDLQGRVPTVAQIRDFEGADGSFKRQDYVDRLLNDERRPDRFAQRSADHLARVWRRMMVPASAPNAGLATQLDPWLSRQFSLNTPYDQVARKLMLVAPQQPQPGLGGFAAPAPANNDPDAAAGVFQQSIGATPENLTSAYVRVFLGVRINCAQCHDHPLADWKRSDFWGIAAFLGGSTSIKPQTEEITYTAKLLWSQEPVTTIPGAKAPREFLADWMVSPTNPNFAATAVNRFWQYLCGRGLTASVDDLDQVSPQERKILDELAKLFVESGYDVRWLVTGICKSKVYQQAVGSDADSTESFVHRPLKTLLPEQVFDSLEQALGLPIARVDQGPRYNGEREQFVARMNEAAAETPADYKGGIPQALMLMNGKLTADATSLENSRTLRAVVEAPFLGNEERLETLYLAALSRVPRAEEAEFLLKHVDSKASEEERKEAFAQIFWGILNSPEFVLSR